jgi:WD40 repeat protein
MKKIMSIVILIILTCSLLESQNLIKNFGNNHVTTTAISFSPDGRSMLIGGYAKVYDVNLLELDFRTIPKDTETQLDVATDAIVFPDGRTFLLTKNNRLEIWDLQSRTIKKSIRDNQLVMTACCISHDGMNIIYMRKNGDMVFINSSDYVETVKKNVSSDTPVAISQSPDGKKLLIGTKGSNVITFDVGSQSITSKKINAQEIEHIEFSPNSDLIAVSSLDGRIWLGKYPSMDQVRSWQANPAGQTAISFHPSGRYLASGGKDKKICIWSIPDCSKITEWEAHKFPLSSLSFSPSGVQLASGSFDDVLKAGDGDIKLWSFDMAKQYISSAKETNQESPPSSLIFQFPRSDTSSQKRLALVIGNGNYTNSTLANPENDAREIKRALAIYGFDVIEYENLNQSQIKKAMDEFGEKLKNYDVGLFFYAGHGIQSKGYNYLIPVDASLRSEEQVEYDCVQADRIVGLMEASGTKVNIIILDACRNNPFERSWTRASSGKGLAYMNAPSGTLIAYATAPGSTASDGSGQNGLYTSAILESIKIPNITILQMFQNVRSIVSQKSGKQQIPWESTSLTGDFYFYRVNP